MLNKIKPYFSRITKYQAIIGILVIVAALEGVALLVSHSRSKASTEVTPEAARIERVDGDVGVAHALTQQVGAEQNWGEAKRNTSLSTGDRVYARKGSRTSVAFTGRNYARLNSDSMLDVLALADRRTQLALRSGSAVFDVGSLDNGDLFEVGTPYGAVDFHEPGLYQVGIGDGDAWVSVLSGLAQVIGLAGSGEISKGQLLRFAGQSAEQAFVSQLAPNDAASIIDDYYGYNYSDVYDGRYRSYDTYLEDPNYCARQRHSLSYDYVAEEIPGAYDLDTYGDWTDISGYGHCWAPRVDANWAPYRNGYWDTDEVWGPTWVADEPWGWAPYHYGRWACVNNTRWVWVPDAERRHPVYAPALVAFVPLTQSNQIGWVPLAPGEPYVPRYYDANFQPRYLASAEQVREVNTRRAYANANIPQAVTVVPMQEFTRQIRPNVVTAVNPQSIAQTQPVLDPYSIQNLRVAATRAADERAKFKMDKALSQQMVNTPVITSTPPVAIPGRGDLSKTLQVATVPEEQKKHKMKMQDGGQVATAAQPNGLPRIAPQVNGSGNAPARIQQPTQPGWQAPQNAQMSRREMKQLAREQRNQQNAQGNRPGQPPPQVSQSANNQPSAEVTRQERKAQKRLERQQQAAGSSQSQQIIRQSQAQGQQREQRRAQQAAAQQQVMIQRQQQAAAQAAQRAAKQQRQAQRQFERQQQMNTAIQQRQAVIQQNARQQQKAERRLERQMPPPQVVRPPQPQGNPRVVNPGSPAPNKVQRQAEKAQRKAERGNH